MKEDMFRYLPPEIVIHVLSILPISTIMSCKCVCKSWSRFVESPEFAKSHHAISQQLFIMSPYKIIEFVDKRYPQHPASCSKRCFEFPIHSSVDGLCFLCGEGETPLYICNPITRDYIQLPSPREKPSNSVVFGFGLNQKTGRYKLVRIVSPKCEVYTLGAGSWRSIKADSSIQNYEPNNARGLFLNGNLHWLAFETTGSKTLKVSCFDLATELFSAFSLPSLSPAPYDLASLTAFEDELCVCFDLPAGDICIWLMKEYGIEKSWTRTFVMKKAFPENVSPINVVKVFKDGETFFHIENGDGVTFIANKCCPNLLLRSKKTNATRTIYLHADARTRPVSYTPSFLSVLKILKLENVHALGTGSWRSFSAGTQIECSPGSVGASLNGNLHWLAFHSGRISCFNHETKLLSSISSPPELEHRLLKELAYACVVVANIQQLIFGSYGDEIDKSWSKEFIIREDWGFLIVDEHHNEIFCYSSGTIHNIASLFTNVFH